MRALKVKLFDKHNRRITCQNCNKYISLIIYRNDLPCFGHDSGVSRTECSLAWKNDMCPEAYREFILAFNPMHGDSNENKNLC